MISATETRAAVRTVKASPAERSDARAAGAQRKPRRPGPLSLSALWRDRGGRFSPLRLIAALVCAAPFLWLVLAFSAGAAGPEPIDVALHVTGESTVTFLIASLAITPMRRAFGWLALLKIRRMLGLATLFYALLHLTAYAFDQGLNLGRVASEIALRTYLTIGFVALCGLLALGVTSTDRWIRRLGPRWRRLHQLSYPIAALGLLHYLLQSKLDAGAAVFMSGLFALLMLYRAAVWRGFALDAKTLASLAALAALATMGFEVAWYAGATTLSPAAIFSANFSLAAGLSPAAQVGLVGGAAAAVAAALSAWRCRAAAAA